VSNNIATAQKATVQSMLMKMKPQLEMALPKHVTPDRFLRIALTELNSTPKLRECDSTSFLAALMTAAQLGVEPGKALGHCYILPYGKTAQFILGYRGMIDLARRSGQIVSLSAHEVYTNDFFEYEYGIDERLCHRPSMKDRGDLVAFYAIAKLQGGGYQFEVMSVPDVDDIRKRSKAGGSGPWVTDYIEMAKKTVIRRLFKYLPISVEMQRAITIDEAADRGEQKELMDNIFVNNDESTTIDEDGVVVENQTATEHLKSASDKLADKLGA